MINQIITRFAPSPTGFLHIGSIRTALFNWLYAYNQKGKMLLRIEDTDIKRNTKENIDSIYQGLHWLGLEWDGNVVLQSKNIKRHQEIAQYMLDNGFAYKCYSSKEDLDKMRRKAKFLGKPIKYDGTWRDNNNLSIPNDIKPVIRFKTPKNGYTVIKDKIQGEIKVNNDQLDDVIILRSNKTPTYMLSSVVDDHDMNITHVIRGDDHLNSAIRQVCIYNAMGWKLPTFAHIPLIHGEDGKKLSKRHGSVNIIKYRDMGFLPEAMRNYLVRLGWSYNNHEIISTEKLKKYFNINSIRKSPSKFNLIKLKNLNAYYIRNTKDSELINILNKFSINTIKRTSNDLNKIIMAMPIIKLRAKTLIELNDSLSFIFIKNKLNFNKKIKKLLTNKNRMLIINLIIKFESISNWSKNNINKVIKDYIKEINIKFIDIGQSLRIALTGTVNAPSIFDIAIILGKKETIKRMLDLKNNINIMY